MSTIISKIYPGLACEQRLYLLGAEIPSLWLFTAILKMDEEFTYEAYLKLFKSSIDSLSFKDIKNTFDTTAPLAPEDVFGEKVGNNSEVRRAIFSYVSPGKIFAQVKTQSLDKWATIKSFPKYEIKNAAHAADSSAIHKEDIVCTMETRKENYELLRVIDERVTQSLPYRAGMIIMLKMTCPSSKKIYYEYIDPSIFPEEMYDRTKYNTFLLFKKLVKNKLFKKPGDLVQMSLCWQMRKRNGKPITQNEYGNIVQET